MRRAFTLLEVLVVVVVIGILAAIVIPNFASGKSDAQYAMAKAFEDTLTKGVSLYTSNNGGHVPQGFFSFVSFGAGSDRNTVFVTQDMRRQLKDPNEDVGVGNQIILEFGSGLVATYTWESDGSITADYVGPGAP